MEPVTSFGIAAGVLQFVTFATTLVSTANDIKNSAQGLSPQNEHIAHVTNRLHTLASKISLDLQALDDNPDEGKILGDICRGCLDLAEELQQRLRRFNGNQTKMSKFRSYRLALEELWDRSTIESLFERLTMFRGEIDSFLLASMSQQITGINGNQSSLVQILLGNSNDVLERMREEHLETRRQIITTLVTLAQTGLDSKFPNGFQTSYSTAKQMAPGIAIRMVRESLGFSALNRRFEAIPEHHARTFEWIFDPNPAGFRGWGNFPLWLQSGTGVYWINGKAGSGKSTLMKFIAEHPKLRSHLSAWAGRDRLVVSHHFFWRKGEEEERSLHGLLRTILHNIFHERPDLVGEVLRDRVNMAEEALVHHLYMDQVRVTETSTLPVLPDIRETLDRWTMKDLTTTLGRLTESSVTGVKFFFLIDGLDEFEGDHHETVEMLHAISSSDKVKVCISSRPLPLFEKVFGEGLRLKLQDLTRGDIALFVEEKLYRSVEFRSMARSDMSQARALAIKIIDKAAGVFLWVMLVVRSMLQGLVNNDTIHDLHRRLDVLPPDLEDLYWHIIKGIDPIYKHKALMVFQVCQEARKSITTLLLSFMLEDPDEDTVISAPIRLLTVEEEMQRVKTVDFRLRSICAGLVEVQDSGTVSFLHRTVGDFFEDPKVINFLQESAGRTGLNPHMAMLKACIYHLKWQPTPRESAQAAESFWTLVEEALCAAMKAERAEQELSIGLMDALDSVASFRWVEARDPRTDSNLHWSNFIQFNSRNIAPKNYPGEIFLHCAARFQLNSYLRNLCLYQPYRLQNVGQVSLLSAAIPRVIREGSFQPQPAPQLPDPSTVELLLQNGNHPNRGFQETEWNEREHHCSPWKNALQHVFLDFHPRNVAYGKNPAERKFNFGRRWVLVLDLLLRYGADPNAQLQRDRFTGSVVHEYGGSDGVLHVSPGGGTHSGTIVHSPLSVVRDVIRHFDREGADALETQLINAGAQYVAHTGDGRSVVLQVQSPENLVDPPSQENVTYAGRAGPGRLRSIPSAPGVRLNLRKAAGTRKGYFLDIVE
ncbi:P-loop-containing protein [Naviculisporaceae sp. PSN 640]